MTIDANALRDEFRYSNMAVAQRALWCSGFPGAEPNTCRYCGKHWRKWAGSKLDGHAACVVTDDFKRRLAGLLSDAAVTYTAVSQAIGVSPAVVRSVRSWIQPTRMSR